MKKFLKVMASILCVGTIALSATACTEVISAYDIAVKNGFVGTEQEWLASLKGKDGIDGEDGKDAPAITVQELYEQAKLENPELTYEEFCQQIGITNFGHNDVEMIANNIMSVVEIYCGWTKTTTVGGLLAREEVDYSMSTGSGVIVNLDKEKGNALVITNYHVLYNKDSDAKGICRDRDMRLYLHGAVINFYADSITGFNDGGADAMMATYVGGSMDYDVALLRIENSDYLKKSCATEAKIGDSERAVEGEKVFAIGNPDGAGISVTSGILSVKSEYIDIEAIDERDVDGKIGTDTVSYRVMRTDAAINGGNSGGALFNAKGELIGITNAKSVGTDKDDMGYALPIYDVVAVANNILDNGKGCVMRGMLGVMVGQISGVAEKNEDGTLNIVQKFAVAQEVAASSFSYGKLQLNDVFVWGQIIPKKGTAGEKVYFDRQYQLNTLLLNVRLGDTVKLGIMREVNGVESEVTVELVFNSPNCFVAYN